jgi:hypothetical protein
MTTVIPPPRHTYLYSDEGNGNYTTYSPLYTNPGACVASPRWRRGIQDEAWPQRVAPADREAKRSNACCISALQGKLFPPDKEEDGHA